MNLKINRTRKFVMVGVYVRKYMYTGKNLDTGVTLFRYAMDYKQAAHTFEKAFGVPTVIKVCVCKPIILPLDQLLNNDSIITNLNN